MYKIFISVFCSALLLISCGDAVSFDCKKTVDVIDDKWINITNDCVTKVTNQVQTELQASITYLSMAAHFSSDFINLPGFAKFFFESASEERQHAIKLIEYLSMRGKLTTVENLIKFPKPVQVDLKNGLTALNSALSLEKDVTNSIKEVIAVCENSSGINDYHISDWLTGEYLEEQYKSMRDLAGKASTLTKLISKESHNKNLAEFIFDKKLLGIDF